MLWTVAVIADSAEAFYETFVGRLSPADKDALWRDYLRFGELFGMSLDSAPPTYAAFRDYWEEIWTGGTLELTDEARAVGLAIAFEIPMPRYLHPSREVHNLVLAGTLPGRVRRMYGIRWNAGSRSRVSLRGRRPARGPPADARALAPRRQHRVVRDGRPDRARPRRRGPRDLPSARPRPPGLPSPRGPGPGSARSPSAAPRAGRGRCRGRGRRACW